MSNFKSVFSVVFFFVGIISLAVVCNGRINTLWWTSLVLGGAWLVWIFKFADWNLLYKKCGISYIVEQVFELK